ncbi:hypothetical protein E4T56_gene6563, partial [Termitomyces sp. T112]
LEGRDLDFQIDYTSHLTTRKFATENPALVRAVNAAFRAEGKWISENGKDAEYIAQKAGKYSDEVRDRFIALKRNYRYFAVNDEQFVGELQKAADWLVARKILPEPVKTVNKTVSTPSLTTSEPIKTGSPELEALLNQIRAGASDRERDRVLPFE